MRIFAAICAVLISTAVAAESPVPPQPSASGYGAPISMSDAQELIQRAIEQSKAKGFKMAIAVVEPSGELVAFARMDDAPYGSIKLAQQKARTAARFRITTASAEERVQGGRLVLLSADEFVTIGGGVPIIVNGKVVGALGVSGATAAEDSALAAATIAVK